MLVNSSSVSQQVNYYCSQSQEAFFISGGMITVKVMLVLLLSTVVLYLGYQQRQQSRSSKAATHADLFAYHLAALEIIWCPGFILYFLGHYSNNIEIIVGSHCCFSTTFFGEVLFHFLTCAEWYLAVVHPITYLSLRNARGVRIRNISIGSVWLISLGLNFLHVNNRGKNVLIAVLSVSIVSIGFITFCSISVLCVLIRPQTGTNDGKRRWISQSKLRAFHTITAISCVLWLWFGGLCVSYSLIVSSLFTESYGCIMIAGIGWLDLPTFLVSPLLYLHGTKTTFCNCYKPNWGCRRCLV